MQLSLPPLPTLPTNLTPKAFFLALAERIAGEFGLTYADLRGPIRVRHYIKARRKLSQILRTTYNWSLPRIGLFLNRDHSSIHNLLHPKKQLTTTPLLDTGALTSEENSCPTSVC